MIGFWHKRAHSHLSLSLNACELEVDYPKRQMLRVGIVGVTLTAFVPFVLIQDLAGKLSPEYEMLSPSPASEIRCPNVYHEMSITYNFN